jgi:hypothetical protein
MATAAQALADLQKAISDLAAAAKSEEQLGSAGLVSVALVNGSANFAVTRQLKLVSGFSLTCTPDHDWCVNANRLVTCAPIGNRRKLRALTTRAQDAILPHKRTDPLPDHDARRTNRNADSLMQ